jgi:hypothetical protein
MAQTPAFYRFTMEWTGGAVMSNPTAEPKPPSFGIGKFLFVIVLVVIFFLLAQTMVRHRFFRGGWVNRNGSIGP